MIIFCHHLVIESRFFDFGGKQKKIAILWKKSSHNYSEVLGTTQELGSTGIKQELV